MNESPRSQAQRDYLNRQLRHQRKIRAARFMLIILFLALWELSASFGWLDSFIFSSPSRIMSF